MTGPKRVCLTRPLVDSLVGTNSDHTVHRSSVWDTMSQAVQVPNQAVKRIDYSYHLAGLCLCYANTSPGLGASGVRLAEFFSALEPFPPCVATRWGMK